MSIGLPVHDGEPHLRAAIDSILGQSFTDFELVISDNASTDGSEAICRAYATSDPRIRYFRSATNVGATRNFNQAFAHARARYFKWAAHDDVIAPTFVERCVEVLDRDPGVVLCHSHTRIIDERGARVGDYVYSAGYASGDLPSQRFRDMLAEDRWCFELFGLIRAETMRATDLLGAYVGSDRGFLAELAMRGRFAVLPECLFSNRDHPGRAIRRFPAHHTRAVAENPTLAGRRVFPHWRILAEYVRRVRRVPMPPAERARCYLALGGWLRRHQNWARLGADLVIAAVPGSGDLFLRLSGSERHWLADRVRGHDR